MIPENTSHCELSIYFDFLEDNGNDTQELREFVSKVHWHYESRYDLFIGVGGVGVVSFVVGGVGINGAIGVGGVDFMNYVGFGNLGVGSFNISGVGVGVSYDYGVDVM